VLLRILEIFRDIDYPPVSDDDLLAAADQIFTEYDRRESGK